jgi:AcrR family transcriptional regulator
MMPRHPLNGEQIREFRGRVCAAAARLFAERGFDAVTLRAIAAAIGCSPMAPYRYFRDKEEIFAQVRAMAFQRFAQRQLSAMERYRNPARRLAALGRAYIQFALEYPDDYRIMFELRQDTQNQHPELLAAERGAWEPLRQAVGEAVESGLIQGNPETLAHVFWSAVHGLVSLHLAGKLKLGKSLKDLVEPLMTTVLRGNLPRASRRRKR